MKLILTTQHYGKRSMVYIYSYPAEMVFFRGREPHPQQMITVEFVGLKAITTPAIRAWLLARSGQANTRQTLLEIPEDIWRPTVLEDFLTVSQYTQALWSITQHFSLADIQAFVDRWWPQAETRLHQLLALSEPEAKLQGFDREQDFLARVLGVTAQLGNALNKTHHQLLTQWEERHLPRLRQENPFMPEHWLEVAATLRAPNVCQTILREMAQRLSSARLEQERLHTILATIGRNPPLRQAVHHDVTFWNWWNTILRLEQNLSDATVDISAAREQKVMLNWETVESRRIGRIIPGRTALVVQFNGAPLYIAAPRKLKFQIRRAGGQLRKWGNTLTLAVTRKNELQQALLEVETLDTLANVAPAQAVARLAHLNLPATHPVFDAAARAAHDPRYAHILADLLIELTVGLDADVARRLLREQSRLNKR
ncbi:MAG: hypothetical protein KA314_20155 [Chloroflexi bacterium]|nr:hypothetical protein [Chloroflexota bacterium]MBP8058151.1 hypothetical protein [Chloroflexota bacterium]